MRGLNDLKTRALITSDEVIFHAPTDHELDPRVVTQNILVAERRFIKPMLGAAVYNELVDAKNALVKAANLEFLTEFINEDRPPDRDAYELKPGYFVNSDEFLNDKQLLLWNEYLHKIVAECVWFTALPVNRSRFTSKGVVKNFPDQIGAINTESVSTDLADLKHLMDRGLQDRISPLMNDLHEHLCRIKYAGYDKECACDDTGAIKAKKSAIVFGMYDDDDCRTCGNAEARAAVASLASGVVSGPVIEYFYREGVTTALINFSPGRASRLDGDFVVEQLDDDGVWNELAEEDIEIEVDSTGAPSVYVLTWELEAPVRITMT